MENIKYATLHHLLAETGFTEHLVEGSYAAFRHANSDTLILLAIHEPDEVALGRDVLYVRSMLDARGILRSEEFDRRLAKSSPSKSRAS